MFTLSTFIDIWSAYVDAIDTSRTNVDTSYKYKHIAGELPDSDLYNSIVNNHNAQPSGDIFVVFEPYSFINDMDGLVVAEVVEK
jgi:hypothetical protein